MTCPQCGATNAPGVRFCSNCGHALAEDAPASAVPAPPPTAPAPTPPSSGGPRVSPAMLAIGGGVALVLLGVLVWALFLRGDDEPARVVTTPSPTTEPSPTATTTGPTGATVTTGGTGTTGTTGATGAVSELPAGYDLNIALCNEIDDALNCVDEFEYNQIIQQWLLPASEFAMLYLDVEGAQAGDNLRVEFYEQDSGTFLGEVEWDITSELAANPQVILYADMSGVVADQQAAIDTNHEIRLFLNGTEISDVFGVPLTFGFCDC